MSCAVSEGIMLPLVSDSVLELCELDELASRLSFITHFTLAACRVLKFRLVAVHCEMLLSDPLHIGTALLF